MESSFTLPDYITHYYTGLPFRSLTALNDCERAALLRELAARQPLPRRLSSEFYFEQRLRYELEMHRQFAEKGGRPDRLRPQYAVLGESEIWARIRTQALRIPLAGIAAECLSFTYTDSWTVYVDRDLDGNHLPRKPQYGTVYLLQELPDVIRRYGWPGDRWKTDPEWEHDLYVEVQIWSDAPLKDHPWT